MGRFSLLIVITIIIVASITMVSINRINSASTEKSADYANVSEANMLGNSAIEKALNQYQENGQFPESFKTVNDKQVKITTKNTFDPDKIMDTVNIVSTVINANTGEIYDSSAAQIVIDRREFPNHPLSLSSDSSWWKARE